MSKKKKPSTLYPDSRKDYYSEWEDFLLTNSDLILLLSITGVFFVILLPSPLDPYFKSIVIVLILVLNASFFASPDVLLR